MSFPRYPKYKPSGVEWLGDVPEGWDVVPFKHRCSRYALYGANMSSDEYVTDGVRFLRTTDISESGELEPDGVFVSTEVAREYLLKDKDILISRSGTIGRAFVFAADVHPECAYAGYLVRFVPTKQLNSRLFFYFTKSAAFSDWLQTQLIFSTIGNVNGQKYAQCRLPLPPLPEQTAIAEFLDRETGKIDGLVAEQRRLMELLKEKRQAVISHAVTKGLNPHAPMKPSGIEWLGEVPEHWGVGALGYFSKISSGSTPDRDTPAYWGGDIPWVKTGEVNYSTITHTEETISKEALALCAVSLAKPGTVLMALYGQGVTRGRVAILGVASAFNQACAAISPDRRISSRFLHALFVCAYEFIRGIGNETTQMNLNLDFVRRFRVLLPPMEEQTAIVEFLDGEILKFDALTAEAQRAIDLLQERRTALISAAVTGQIDVRQHPKN